MLFLRRLERVTIRRENDGNCEEQLLTRPRHSVTGVAGDFACDLVTLDGASEYLVLSPEVDPVAYSAAVPVIRYRASAPGTRDRTASQPPAAHLWHTRLNSVNTLTAALAKWA